MIIPVKHWNRSVYQLSKQCFIGMMFTANRWNRLFAWALYDTDKLDAYNWIN